MSGAADRHLRATTTSGPYPEEAAATPLIDKLRARLGERILSAHAWRGDQAVEVGRDDLIEVVTAIQADDGLGMNMLVDLTVVDLLDMGLTPRFEVVYHFLNTRTMDRLRLKVRVPEDDCRIASLTPLFKAAHWAEREAWEFYGVVFSGHPDLRHILLYPEFQGYPLRKDYPKHGEQPRLELRDYRPWPRPKPADIT